MDCKISRLGEGLVYRRSFCDKGAVFKDRHGLARLGLIHTDQQIDPPQGYPDPPLSERLRISDVSGRVLSVEDDGRSCRAVENNNNFRRTRSIERKCPQGKMQEDAIEIRKT